MRLAGDTHGPRREDIWPRWRTSVGAAYVAQSGDKSGRVQERAESIATLNGPPQVQSESRTVGGRGLPVRRELRSTRMLHGLLFWSALIAPQQQGGPVSITSSGDSDEERPQTSLADA
jgi:hypothetical protein